MMSSQERFFTAMENWANFYWTRSLSEYFDYLKSIDISMHQAYVLTYIHYNEPSKISDICEHMMVSAAAASQMVDRLENQDLVQRTAEPGDRRVRNVVLSDAGKQFVARSIAARENWLKDVPEELDDEQLDQISTALQLLNAAYR